MTFGVAEQRSETSCCDTSDLKGGYRAERSASSFTSLKKKKNTRICKYSCQPCCLTSGPHCVQRDSAAAAAAAAASHPNS